MESLHQAAGEGRCVGQRPFDAGDIAPMAEAQIQIEVRLLTAAMDGIGLQWLLDPSTDVAAAVTVCVDRAVGAWRAPSG
ncbi:hypothetical protein Bfae_24750 [Brachybacterium faecium DSM 4810]|uniref:Uncharacterized protein n=1 Tax=Brachybacterium faecium (strain ATCC 43885 / DSM 4810 / JCM 11609 / LMG 19847 / NBRC 14762 / NCIMB 9860 / 6-10) TaxID=446465 RepID=C7MFP5_BRAFD|nr:hypothetical protein [Brachybacterium faecium]ACU86262.1 hypothetical protein Bfae_24750 [Brachybacterium faecium DSM 4810]